MDTTNFFIALYNKKDDTLSLPYLVDEKIKFTSFPAGKSLTAYVIRTDKPLLATEDDVNELIKKGEAEIIGVPSKVWLGVPLKIGGETVGVVVVQSYTDPTRFTEEHLEILKFVSSQIALAIERKRTEESLKKSEEKYRTLAENINVGIFRSTPGAKGKFIEVNPAMIDMFGCRGKEELLAVNPSDLYQNPEDRARFNEKMLKDGFIKNEESISKRKDGTTFIASDTAVAVKDEKGKVMYYDGIIEDITDRKRVERAIKQLNEILRLINKIMRHDLLNDLNIAKGALDVYAERPKTKNF